MVADGAVTAGKSPELSGDELRGRAVGACVLAVFAFAWLGWGLSDDAASTMRKPALAAAALACLALVVVASRTARHAPSTTSGEAASRPAMGRRFGIIAGLQFAAIFVGSRLLVGSGHSRVVSTFICLAVGLHFFPLRRLFGVPFYNRTGVVLCLVAFVTVLLAPFTGREELWTMLPGLGAAAALYTTAVVLLLAKR